MPKCQEFGKKIIKMNRLLLFIILMLNLLRSALATLDLMALKHMTPALASQSQDSPYCEASGSLQIFMFDMANLLTVWHMQITRKHVQDPTRNVINKVTMPVLVSSAISLVHVVILANAFRIGLG